MQKAYRNKIEQILAIAAKSRNSETPKFSSQVTFYHPLTKKLFTFYISITKNIF